MSYPSIHCLTDFVPNGVAEVWSCLSPVHIGMNAVTNRLRTFKPLQSDHPDLCFTVVHFNCFGSGSWFNCWEKENSVQKVSIYSLG